MYKTFFTKSNVTSPLKYVIRNNRHTIKYIYLLSDFSMDKTLYLRPTNSMSTPPPFPWFIFHHRPPPALHPLLIDPSCGFFALASKVIAAFADLALELLVDCFELTTTTTADVVAFDDESFELFVPLTLALLVDCFELPDLLPLLCIVMEWYPPYESELESFWVLDDLLCVETTLYDLVDALLWYAIGSPYEPGVDVLEDFALEALADDSSSFLDDFLSNK